MNSVTNRASSRLMANPFGSPATRRTIIDGAKVLQYPHGELPVEQLRRRRLDNGSGASRQVADEHSEMLHPLGMTQGQLQRRCRTG